MFKIRDLPSVYRCALLMASGIICSISHDWVLLSELHALVSYAQCI